MTEARRLGYSATCLTCDEPIEPNDLAKRERGVGAWHSDCPPPRSLPTYRRERDRAQRRPRHRDFDDFDDD